MPDGKVHLEKIKQKTTLEIDHKILLVIIWSYRFYQNAPLALTFIIEISHRLPTSDLPPIDSHENVP